MITKSRIQKLEKNNIVSDSPYSKYSNEELNQLSRKLELKIYKAMKDRTKAKEFKTLFIDNPNSYELLRKGNHNSRKANMAVLAQQEAWELKYASSEKEKRAIKKNYATEMEFFKSMAKI